jgi:hypothetical protein
MAAGLALGALLGLLASAGLARGDFVLVSQDLDGVQLFNGAAHQAVTSYRATVGSGGTQGIAVAAGTPIDTGAGFATIKPGGAGLLTDLRFSPADASAFDTFSFRGQLVGSGGSSETFTVKVTDQHGVVTDLGLLTAQVNRDFGPFGVLGLAGETIASVELTAANGFKELKQIELGWQGQADPSVVPVPAPPALLLGLVGVFMLGGRAGWGRWRGRRVGTG